MTPSASEASPNPSMPRLVGLARMAPGTVAVTAALLVVIAIASVAIPAVSADAVDEAVAGAGPGTALLTLSVLLVVRVAAEACSGIAAVAATTRIAAGMRHRLLRAVLDADLRGLRDHPPGDLVTRLTANAAAGAGAVVTFVRVAVALATSLAGLTALWVIDWWLGAAFTAGLIPALFLIRLVMRRITSTQADYLNRLGAIAARMLDALAGLRTIRACGTALREVDRVLRPLPDLVAAGHRTWQVQRGISWQAELILAGLRVCILALAGFGLAVGRLSAGELLATALYLAIALSILDQIDVLFGLGQARASAARVLAVAGEGPADGGSEAGRRPRLPGGPGEVLLEGVTVRLESQTVLDDVHLEIPAGSSVAVVGRSGSGKTTLSQVVGGLIRPDRGRVRIDGADTAEVDPDSLRQEVRYAFEEPVLLGGTVGEAIGYGRPRPTAERVRQAAARAEASGFIERLPAGFDTPLDRAPLSGGERQRLGLARAIAGDGRILVLDDATSSLDTVTEAQVSAAVTEAAADRTRVVVAHRTATADRADRVAWLERGRLRAIGSHRNLWATHPEYRAVFADRPTA
ncbi:ABC transporter ATP-binding protein [Glycomyces xiaoerkulensis]|uniref:ABC transporter ATP-binding protein n=1 Tax=Glycomyces xiaoerkulensis TaxID=2038139 RepID=UPI000C269BF6|nr:ABC transporter ATP-binding protein [Glycomyces xiaoerkulensis]